MFVYNNTWNVCFLRFDRLADKFAGAPVSTQNIKHYKHVHSVQTSVMVHMICFSIMA